jgi:Helix-turn-helix domain
VAVRRNRRAPLNGERTPLRRACDGGRFRPPPRSRSVCHGGRPVSFDLQKMIWDDPEPKGAALTVLLCLASFVPQERWKRGEDLRAWPSQSTLARRCNCSRSTVERALEDLVSLDKIRDTGLRRTRMTIVWELYPSGGSDLPDPGAGDMPRSEAGDMPYDGAGGPTETADLPHPEHDLPHLGQRPAPSCSINLPQSEAQVSNRSEETESDVGVMRAGAGARASIQGVEDRDLAGDLADVENWLERRPDDKLLRARRDELSAELAVPGGER